MAPGDPRALRRAARLLDCAERRVRYHDVETIETLVDEADRLSSGDDRCFARALTVRLRVHRINNRFDAAIKASELAIRCWQSLNDPVGEAVVRTHVAHILLVIGNSDEALGEGLAAMTLAETAKDDHALVEALRVVAYVYLGLSQFDRATTLCEQGIEIGRKIGDAVAEGALLDTLGCVYTAMSSEATSAGDEDGARTWNLRSIDASMKAMGIARAVGHRANALSALANVAEGLVRDGRPEQALALMQSSVIDGPHSGKQVSHYLGAWGSIWLALDRLDEAIDLFERAHAASPYSEGAIIALEQLAAAYERKGEFATALARYKRYHALFRQVASEKAQRSASVAAVRLETQQARASAHASRSLAEDLQRSNEQLSRRAEDLMHQSLHDALTGLGNRRLMERCFDSNTAPYALALIDVDHFKTINDGWSHSIGDAVLRQIATLLRGGCRPSDTPLRYGGEEFAILLGTIDEGSARNIAERIRAGIEAFDWSRIAPGLSVTVSIGLALNFEASGDQSVLELADRRLYEAKNAGRNRVIDAANEAAASMVS